jgi:hypothetical protein
LKRERGKRGGLKNLWVCFAFLAVKSWILRVTAKGAEFYAKRAL